MYLQLTLQLTVLVVVPFRSESRPACLFPQLFVLAVTVCIALHEFSFDASLFQENGIRSAQMHKRAKLRALCTWLQAAA